MTTPNGTSRDARLLLAGGYGLVGSQVARLVRAHHPRVELLLGGRTPARGEALARELGNARAVALDTGAARPLAHLEGLDAVAGLVHDHDDRLLRACASRGVAYLDITRDVDAFGRAWVGAALEPPRAPILFASNWMAGVPAVLAHAMATSLASVDAIELSILFYMADHVGPDSESAEGGLIAPFVARSGGAWTRVAGLSDPRSVRFPSGLERPVYRAAMADGITLAQASGARDVAVRLGVDDASGFRVMRALMRCGLWSPLQRIPAFRRAVAAKERTGAPHEIVVEVRGRADDGAPKVLRATILDPKGQSHLTALGVLFGVERILGLGTPALPPGPAVPESSLSLTSAERLVRLLRAEGVSVEWEHDR